MKSAFRILFCVFAMSEAALASAAAATMPETLNFHTSLTKTTGMSSPWTANLTLKVNAEGIVSGTYRSTSIKPDPFYGKIIQVRGGLTGENIHFSFVNEGNVRFSGKLDAAGIVGTAFFKNSMMNFVAKRVS